MRKIISTTTVSALAIGAAVLCPASQSLSAPFKSGNVSAQSRSNKVTVRPNQVSNAFTTRHNNPIVHTTSVRPNNAIAVRSNNAIGVRTTTVTPNQMHIRTVPVTTMPVTTVVSNRYVVHASRVLPVPTASPMFVRQADPPGLPMTRTASPMFVREAVPPGVLAARTASTTFVREFVGPGRQPGGFSLNKEELEAQERQKKLEELGNQDPLKAKEAKLEKTEKEFADKLAKQMAVACDAYATWYVKELKYVGPNVMTELSWEEAYQICLMMWYPEVVEAAVVQRTWCIAQYSDYGMSIYDGLPQLPPDPTTMDPAELKKFQNTMEVAWAQALDLYHECMKNKMDPASLAAAKAEQDKIAAEEAWEAAYKLCWAKWEDQKQSSKSAKLVDLEEYVEVHGEPKPGNPYYDAWMEENKAQGDFLELCMSTAPKKPI